MELSEWAAYERYAGPLDDTWRDECLAAIEERLHEISYFFSEKLYSNPKTNKHGPIPKPERYPRPWEALKLKPKDEGEQAVTPYQELWPTELGGKKGA